MPISTRITAITPNQIGSKPNPVTDWNEDRDRHDKHGEPVHEHAEHEIGDDDQQQDSVRAKTGRSHLLSERGRQVRQRQAAATRRILIFSARISPGAPINK
jgi:hypothetical protein